MSYSGEGWGQAGIYDRGDTICVIGAGPSGLTALKNLKEYGFGVDCYDRETSVGGGWNWRHDRSPMYASTHLISSKPFTQFPDFPMPDDWPDYPKHTQVLSYLERYAAHFGLTKHIWFGSEVIRVEPADAGRWIVTTRSTGGHGGERTHSYAGVVIANGHNWSPYRPDYPGLAGYHGEVIHAASYKDAAQLRGRKVLVVGAGNTGCDIAVEAAAQAAKCWHSTRRGYWYTPKYTLGRPADQVNDLMLWLRLPLWLRQTMAHRTIRATVGDLGRFGLPRPDHKIYETHPIVNSQLVYYLGHGAITAVPEVAEFHRNSVRLTNGVEVNPDLVVLATGYRPLFDFIEPELLGLDADGRPRLAMHAFPRRQPTLAVAGLLQPDSGLFPLVHWQMVAFARMLRQRESAPAKAATVQRQLDGAATKRWTGAKVQQTPRHWFEVSHTRYLSGLAGLLAQAAPGDTDARDVRPLRRREWALPAPPAGREVLRARPEPDGEGRADKPPLLFVPGFGQSAWIFAEHWLEHAADRGFDAYAMSLRGHGTSSPMRKATLRAYAHDVAQVAAGLPRQAVIVAHGAGALVAAHTLARYPARAAVLVAPVLGGLGTALRNPWCSLPALAGGKLRLPARQLFSRELPAKLARGYASRLRATEQGRASARAQWQLLAGRQPEPPVGHPPVLVVGSPDDRIVPAGALRAAAQRYGAAPLLFPGMGHNLMLDARWREPIDAILDWLDKPSG